MEKPAGIKNVNIDCLTRLARYMPSAPVEIKGYKIIVNLPDWQKIYQNRLKFKKKFATAEFFFLIRSPFFVKTKKESASAIRFARVEIDFGCHRAR